MYPTPQEKAAVEAAEKLMVETMARYDPSHDAFHVERVRKTALSIARALPSQKPDLLVVELAALLHDVLDKKYVSAAEAADPYKFFLPFFEQLASGLDLDLLTDGRGRQISKIVENVSWTTEKNCAKCPLHAPPGSTANESTAIQHFHDKLLHIQGRLKTEPGKRMGTKRHQVILDFLASIEEEYQTD
ncbi:hypothetical protein SERLADRAFT_369699 [Serpula lacrymans var. lacrymans S7.9]|uniref:HD/PDEase domain-containing protein n=1 Tax=Serpula lacrymans var. lacrymans (strain S7.9) TaxID=578457 RepID=F8NWX1_SERL9|nr:uncharacterized protein SERLADRAFT_369699 [Serpula lacrymans var. lacrymans S7.9]EGO24447.1 hypothetical protein SERLADRAFT_369699 [Serpula lacrymans var. lacrymans S7.9]